MSDDLHSNLSDEYSDRFPMADEIGELKYKFINDESKNIEEYSQCNILLIKRSQ